MIVIENKNKKTIVFALIAVAIVFVLAIAFFAWQSWREKNTPTDYVIPNVPYFGIHNHKGKNSALGRDTASAVASTLEYWNPGKNDLNEINKKIVALRSEEKVSREKLSDFDKISKTVSELGDYNTEVINLNVSDLKKYINSKARTPLFVFLPVSADQPLSISYQLANVLIGVKEKEGKLVFHNFWLGNNLEVSYEDYLKMIDRMPPTMRNNYLIIQPKNLDDKLREVKARPAVPYAPRTSVMERGKEMFKNYAIASGGMILGVKEPTKTYLEKIINDPDFENYCPPYMKVLVYSRLAEIYSLGLKDNSTALKYAQISIDLNHDLNQPFLDWAGYENDANKWKLLNEQANPYRIIGDIYKAMGNDQKAKESYQKGTDIYPLYNSSKNDLN